MIGSLLRPAYLKEARQAREAGTLPTPKFKRIEDRAVNEAIALQETAGLDVVTGKIRRRRSLATEEFAYARSNRANTRFAPTTDSEVPCTDLIWFDLASRS